MKEKRMTVFILLNKIAVRVLRAFVAQELGVNAIISWWGSSFMGPGLFEAGSTVWVSEKNTVSMCGKDGGFTLHKSNPKAGEF